MLENVKFKLDSILRHIICTKLKLFLYEGWLKSRKILSLNSSNLLSFKKKIELQREICKLSNFLQKKNCYLQNEYFSKDTDKDDQGIA